MLALNQLRKENETGFTLMELLVVILIIGILAAIAIPMFLAQRKSAVDSTTVSDTHTLATAIATAAVKTPYGDRKATDFSDVQLSAGTQWTMTPFSQGYCLRTFNPDGDSYVALDKSATYDSTNGGLNKDGSCAAEEGAAGAPAGNALGTPGAISFTNPVDSSAITADGSYSYNPATQEVTYSFDFKNLEAGKTYHVLIKPQQNEGDPHRSNFVFADYAVTSTSPTVSATVSLKNTVMGYPGPALSSPSSVKIERNFTLESGWGSADVYDPSPLTMK